jgi:hypothetical protein
LLFGKQFSIKKKLDAFSEDQQMALKKNWIFIIVVGL